VTETHQKIIGLLILSCFLFVFVSVPSIQKVTKETTKVVAFKKVYTPPNLARASSSKKKVFYLRFLDKLTELVKAIAEACSPIANIAGAVSPLLTIFWSLILWIRRKKE
jgi:hypothetical protein